MHLRKTILLLSLLLSAFFAAGCGAPKSLPLTGGDVPLDAQTLTQVVRPEDLEQLDALTALTSVDFSGSVCYEEILAWAQSHPQGEVRYSVLFPDGSAVDAGTEGLDISALSLAEKKAVPELLPYLPSLRYVKLGGETAVSTALVQSYLDQRPELELSYRLPLLNGTVSSDIQTLDFAGHNDAQAETLAAVLPYLPALRSVDLGSQEESPELSWKAIAALQNLRPDVDFCYRFRLYDQDFSTLDETMNFSHVKLRDAGEALWQVLPCMRRLQQLDMDSCGIDNETMAAVRDRYPEVNVVWRVWFGGIYSARTDATKILASNPGVGGSLMEGTYENLKYFTKLKYLDLGHQPLMDDISFVSYMPDLEVAILAMGCWWDASPLADCPRLEFLEIQTTQVKDLSPLAGLRQLRHLNLGHLFDLTDISPIYDLELERLWIGTMTPIPEEQVAEYRRRHPDCIVNTEGYDPHYMWRWIGINQEGEPIRDPRYDLLVEQMGYDREEYAFEWVETRGW